MTAKTIHRRDFFKLGAAASAGAVLSTRNAAGSPIFEAGAGIPQGGMVLPENPGFKTKHLVTIILGNGARKIDVIDNPEHSPFQTKMAAQGTVFTEDYGETANLHGYMYSEVLSGVDAPAQRPRYPTWAEYIRKKAGGTATDYWTLQGASYYRAWTWDVKHFSQHPEYGVKDGSTSLTMNRIFYPEQKLTAAEIVDLNVEKGLGHTPKERKHVEDFIGGVLAQKSYIPASTREPVINREIPYGDAQVLTLVPQILKEFKPKSITAQILALDDAHADFGFWDYNTDYWEYIKHIKTTDEADRQPVAPDPVRPVSPGHHRAGDPSRVRPRRRSEHLRAAWPQPGQLLRPLRVVHGARARLQAGPHRDRAGAAAGCRSDADLPHVGSERRVRHRTRPDADVQGRIQHAEVHSSADRRGQGARG